MYRKKLMLVLLVILGGQLSAARAETPSGLQPGSPIPAIALKDQAGNHQTFESIRGPNGLLILFNRSADWCPFCKSQLIDLESARKRFEAKGIHVVSITYDSPEILGAFARRRGIHFTMLSDPDSQTIKNFGVLNTEATGTQAGIAIPNYFLVGPDGVILNRLAETELLDRVTANYYYDQLFGTTATLQSAMAISSHTPHLNIKLAQSDEGTAPGARIRLLIQLELGKDTHLYAPGADAMGYHSVKLTLEPSDLYLSKPLIYPRSTILEFRKLHEKVPVFEHTTVVSEDVWAVRSPRTNATFVTNPHLVIHGTLEYQACTSTTCFAPEKIPVQWAVNVRAKDLDTERVSEDLRRK